VLEKFFDINPADAEMFVASIPGPSEPFVVELFAIGARPVVPLIALPERSFTLDIVTKISFASKVAAVTADS